MLFADVSFITRVSISTGVLSGITTAACFSFIVSAQRCVGLVWRFSRAGKLIVYLSEQPPLCSSPLQTDTGFVWFCSGRAHIAPQRRAAKFRTARPGRQEVWTFKGTPWTKTPFLFLTFDWVNRLTLQENTTLYCFALFIFGHLCSIKQCSRFCIITSFIFQIWPTFRVWISSPKLLSAPLSHSQVRTARGCWKARFYIRREQNRTEGSLSTQ